MALVRKERGQGALEYLLLIGGAVLVAVIVISLILSFTGEAKTTAEQQFKGFLGMFACKGTNDNCGTYPNCAACTTGKTCTNNVCV
jgi:uncharacterized protein (UPF0333 family)